MDRGAGPGTPASTIFVGNLAYEVSEQQLIDYFSQVGPVKNIRIVTERDTGKPRGFGFIEFYDIPTAESAIRNLNGSELAGRTMRIVFAEGGPPGGEDRFRRRDDDRDRFGDDRGRFGDDRGRFGDDRGRRPPRSRLVGADLAYHASHGVAALLGAPAAPGAPADAITTTLARKTRSELWDYLAQVQALAAAAPGQARALLVANPGLTKALFQAEVILGLVANPLGDIAPKGVAPPDMMAPGRGGPAGPAPGPYGGPPPLGAPLAGPPGALPPGALVMEAPPGALQPGLVAAGLQPGQGGLQYLAPPPAGMQLAPGMAPPLGAPNGMPLPGYAPGPGAPPPGAVLQAPPPGYILAPQQQQLPQQPLPQQPAFVQPAQQMVAQPAPQPAPAGPVDPRMAGAPVDPRARAGAVPLAQQPQQQQQPQQGAPGQAGMTPEMQQALLQQVMNLTPQQIELLPPNQKQQVLALQQQLRAQGQMP